MGVCSGGDGERGGTDYFTQGGWGDMGFVFFYQELFQAAPGPPPLATPRQYQELPQSQELPARSNRNYPPAAPGTTPSRIRNYQPPQAVPGTTLFLELLAVVPGTAQGGK